MSDATLAVVGTYLTAVDADLARTVLEAEGIECMIRSDDCGQQYPWIRGVELLVRSEDVTRAAQILESDAEDSFDAPNGRGDDTP